MAPTSNAQLIRGTPIAERGQANIVKWEEDEVKIIDAYVRENCLTSVPTNYDVEELRERLGMSSSFEWPARIFPIIDTKIRSKMRLILAKNKKNVGAMDTRPDRAQATPGSGSRSTRSTVPSVSSPPSLTRPLANDFRLILKSGILSKFFSTVLVETRNWTQLTRMLLH